ncbi:MAG: fluoride efflux transporter CrcB [Burkholderiaceae bacterium]|nr:fluoride efflux transporter CrcB [Burkholderiaceae bacterium]
MLTIAAICIGASVGALSRWQLGVWLNTGNTLPWGTLSANWVGAYAVGLAVVFFQQHSGLDPAWRLAIVTGLLGALTTFSTFSVETVAMLQSGRAWLAMLNVMLHVVGSLLLTWAGLLTAQAWWRV